MKKVLAMVLSAIFLVCGCAAPNTENSGVSIEPQSADSVIHSAESISVSSEPQSVVNSDSSTDPEVSTESSAVSQFSSETVSEEIGEPMTQAEFDDFFENVLPEVTILLGGEQAYDPNDSVVIEGLTYYRITDEKYNTVGKLKAELAKYFIAEEIDDEINRLFINPIPGYKNDIIYTEKDGFVYVYPKTEGVNREFDIKRFGYDEETNNAGITLYTVNNGTDPFLGFYFTMQRVDGKWLIKHATFGVGTATDIPTPPMGKPVIYLYPEKVTDVTVKLDLNGKLGCTYPAYPKDGWKVTVYPDGKLIVGGEEYDYLFWEGDLNTVFTFDKGFCVKGSDTAAFLKKALSEMGLIPSEYNDFIVYWLPKMEGNAYNLISFIGKEYTDNAKLNITPKPDSVLRVAMAYRPLEKPVTIAPQTFEKFERNGFTVVEWGGAEID